MDTSFIRKKAGTYEIDVIFDNSLLGTTVEVEHNVSSVKLEKTPLSPMQQFKEGIKPEYVKCNQNLHLIIKAEDGSTDCVQSDTVSKLVERGWAQLILSKIGITINSYTPISNETKKEFEITDNVTYLSQTVDEWKNKTPEQLNAYYEKYKDKFYTDLGSFLIKDEMKKELTRQKIQNMHDDFKVFPGMTLDSLPPHISYDAVVNATEGNISDIYRIRNIYNPNDTGNDSGVSLGYFAWSQDGKFAVFAFGNANPDGSTLWAISRDGQKLQEIPIKMKFDVINKIRIVSDDIFFDGWYNGQNNRDVFKYDMKNQALTKLTKSGNVNVFDVMPDGNIVYQEEHSAIKPRSAHSK